MPRRLATLIPVLLALTLAANAQEVLVYTHGSGAAVVDSMVAHADVIDVIAPQAFGVDPDGQVSGSVDARLLSEAARLGIRVMPLVHNRGFNQENLHALLASADARATAIDSMVALGKRHGYWGWQFDFENFHVSRRDAMTRFYRETARALHAAGMQLSIAVVPTDGTEGESPFAKYMADNWRNGFDVAALDSLGDFVSYMTYAEHGAATAPGPIAGHEWTRRMLAYALSEGVDPGRISLGVPFYSGYWAAGHTERTGPRPVGNEVSYERAMRLMEGQPITRTWLPAIGAHLVYWEEEGTFRWIFLEDRLALREKLDRIDPSLRGVSIWVLGAEAPGVWEELAAWKRAGR